MVRYCFVEGCNSTDYQSKNRENKPHQTLYGFPLERERREIWINALVELNKQANGWNPPKNAKICRLHFSEQCIVQIGFGHSRLKPDAIPTKFPNMPKETVNPLIYIISDSTSNIKTDQSEGINSPLILCISKPASQVPEKNQTVTQEVKSIDRVPIDLTPEKKCRYVGDIKLDQVETMSPKALKNACHTLHAAYVKKSSQVKRLQRQQNRYKNRIESLEKVIEELKTEKLLEANKVVVATCKPEEGSIIEDLGRGKIFGTYSEQVKDFAMKTYFYSPKAYTYARQVFKNRLPGPSTVRAWYAADKSKLKPIDSVEGEINETENNETYES